MSKVDEFTQRRFFSKVKVTDTCWLWIGGRGGSLRYGKFFVNGKSELAHRFVLKIFRIRHDRKHVIMHSCDNPICVNPEHLTPGSQLQNMRDKIAKGRSGIKRKVANG